MAQKISASGNFSPRTAFLTSKITFSKILFFSDISVFWSDFRKIGSRIKKFNFSFFSKTYIFFSIFFSRALVTTWITCSTLQNINSSIRLAVNSLWKGLLCPQPSKQCCSKRTFGVPLRKNYTSATRTTFQQQTNFMVEVKGQSQSFPRNFKNHEKKMSKITIFFNILTSVTSDISARYNTPTCAWSNCTKQKLKQFQKIASGYDFSQKVAFWPPPPPPPAKSFLTSIFGGYSLVDFSFP